MNNLSNKKGYPKEVLELHNEFQNTADRILKEANEILKNNANAELSKGRRLIDIGFRNAKQTDLAHSFSLDSSSSNDPEEQDSIRLNNEIKMAEQIQHYQFTYPDNKFITEEQVEIICKKYNLILGNVQRYKGFVPDTNLTAIENFEIKEDDAAKDYVCVGQGNLNWGLEIMASELKSKGWHICPNTKYKIEDRPASLKICAPMPDMDMTGVKIENGYKMEPIQRIIPDPVVLQGVKYGYLIITAWGDEASDEIVVNPKHN